MVEIHHFRQAHNLKVVGSNPTPTTNYINKINDLDAPSKTSVFGVFLRLKPNNDHRVINKVINVRQAYFTFFKFTMDYIFFPALSYLHCCSVAN